MVLNFMERDLSQILQEGKMKNLPGLPHADITVGQILYV